MATKRSGNRRRTKAELMLTALHEACHAVLAVIDQVPIGEVTIECAGDTLGSADVRNVLGGDYLEGRNLQSMLRVRIRGLLAGEVAERIHDPRIEQSLGCQDRNLVDAAIAQIPPAGASFVGDEHCDAYVERLRKQVDSLLRREWLAVSGLAEWLLKRKTVSGEDAERMVISSLSLPLAAKLSRE